MYRNLHHPIVKREHIFFFEATDPTCDYHSHDYLELAYVLRGQARHTYEGQSSIIFENDYFIIDHGKLHTYEQIGDTPLSVLNCMFIPRLFDETLKNKKQLDDITKNHMFKFNLHTLRVHPSNVIFHDDSGYIRELMQRMAREYEERRVGYHELLRCHLITILIEMIRQLDDSTTGNVENEIAQKVINYVDTHFTEKTILQNFSKRYNYSISYVSRIFKRETGRTIQEYLRSIRIHEACRLLANTTAKVTEVAEMVGYEDAKFFTKIFKEQTGFSPRDYRKTHTTKDGVLHS